MNGGEGGWQIHNPDFNYGEFATIRSQAGLNSYKISVKEWVEKTNAIGLRAKAGRYGGTYAILGWNMRKSMVMAAAIYLKEPLQLSMCAI